MPGRAWIIRGTDGEVVTGYWEEFWAQEYVEEHPDEGLTVQEIKL